MAPSNASWINFLCLSRTGSPCCFGNSSNSVYVSKPWIRHQSDWGRDFRTALPLFGLVFNHRFALLMSLWPESLRVSNLLVLLTFSETSPFPQMMNVDILPPSGVTRTAETEFSRGWNQQTKRKTATMLWLQPYYIQTTLCIRSPSIVKTTLGCKCGLNFTEKENTTPWW